jgi:hypothetical protein
MGGGIWQSRSSDLICRAVADDRDVNIVLPQVKSQVQAGHAGADDTDVSVHGVVPRWLRQPIATGDAARS